MMTNRKVILILIGGIVFTVGYNLGVVIGDAKMLSSPPQSTPVVYKQLPVIPFTN